MSTSVIAHLRSDLNARLLAQVDARRLASVGPRERRMVVREQALALLRSEGYVLPQAALTQVINEIADSVVGLGPIERLLRDPEVTEVMVNGPDDVYVERRGRIERVEGGLFEGEEAVLRVIERIVAPLGLRVDASSPWVDARLPNGSRVHAILPPLSLRGPALNVRKFSPVALTADDLLRSGAAGPRMLAFLDACVRGRANIVVSGGTSSGKTTLLGLLARSIPDEERLITIEDAAELRLGKPHVVALEARPANVEGRGLVTVRDLVRNALRMRPDRIIVGEVRGGEALDMLQAMNTGHDGSLTTAHANSPRHLLWRLETMALMSDVDLPVEHIRRQVVSAIDVVVHAVRLASGRRAIQEIAVVDPAAGVEEAIRPVFTLNVGADAAAGHRATGLVPALVGPLRDRGIEVDDTWFDEGADVAPGIAGG